ncbi:MAG: hypothetical protein AB1801_03760, partial [Chloroflexota bacterium]
MTKTKLLTDKLTPLNRLITNKTSAHLALIAGVSGLIYGAIFTLPFPLPRLYAAIPPLDYTKLTHYSVEGLLAYGLGIV